MFTSKKILPSDALFTIRTTKDKKMCVKIVYCIVASNLITSRICKQNRAQFTIYPIIL